MKGRNTLLVVDDEISNLQILSRILGEDYKVITAKDGASALEKAKKHLPDLIVLDIMMPGMDGYQVLEALRSAETTDKIPVVFVTGLNSIEDERKGLSMNAADYISKPFSHVIVKLRVRNQIQIVNQLRTIERLSMFDQLTGLPNRRSFDERMAAEWKRAMRERLPIGILLMDVDRFKIYNDTHGHQQGDVALRSVAQACARVLKRPTDFAARWGGEEFAVLLPGTPLEGALEIAEGIRAAVAAAEIPHENGLKSRVTISIGASALEPGHSHTFDSLLSMADKALYEAKAAGRNRVASGAPKAGFLHCPR